MEMSVSSKSAGQLAAEGAAAFAVSAVQAAGQPAEAEKEYQTALLRDLVGPLPFRITPEETWESCKSATVIQFAQQIYEDRAFDRLPILADALEDAGCTNPAILDHCRGPGPHARGCWVVDLLLGKD
jgi:hypothetical protein